MVKKNDLFCDPMVGEISPNIIFFQILFRDTQVHYDEFKWAQLDVKHGGGAK